MTHEKAEQMFMDRLASAGLTEEAPALDCFAWDKLDAMGQRPNFPRPFGPYREGSTRCDSGSLASGGTRAYCTCDACF